VMKSFSVSGSDPTKQEKFLAYMAPAPHEVWIHLWYISIKKSGQLHQSDGDYCDFISLPETWMMTMISSIPG
jgi:hypothetical protein